MDTKKILRLLICVEILLGIIGICSDSFLESYFPVEIQSYVARMANVEFSTLETFGVLLAIPLFIGHVISWVGLWKLWKPSRLIYTVCLMSTTWLYLFLPVVYDTPFGAILSEYSVLSAGVIIGIIYFSDLKKYFENKT